MDGFALWRSFDCIQQQVQEQLFDLFWIAFKRIILAGHVQFQDDTTFRDCMLGQYGNRTQKIRHFHYLQTRQTRASEMQKIGEELVQSMRFGGEYLEALALRFCRGLTTRQNARDTADTSQWVANLMCQACRELAGCAQALSLSKLFDVFL